MLAASRFWSKMRRYLGLRRCRVLDGEFMHSHTDIRFVVSQESSDKSTRGRPMIIGAGTKFPQDLASVNVNGLVRSLDTAIAPGNTDPDAAPGPGR